MFHPASISAETILPVTWRIFLDVFLDSMFRWFQRLSLERRIQYGFVGAAGTCTVFICSYALPHTVLLSKYKEFMACYK